MLACRMLMCGILLVSVTVYHMRAGNQTQYESMRKPRRCLPPKDRRPTPERPAVRPLLSTCPRQRAHPLGGLVSR